MSKETIAGIRKAIEDAQRANNLIKQQETAKRKAEAFRLEAEHQTLIARNEAKLRATGVVELFEELRDNGVVKLLEEPLIVRREESFLGIKWESEVKVADYQPAGIFWHEDKKGISILFDSFQYSESDGDGGSRTKKRYSSLRAEISESGVLKINEHEMKPGEELGDVVRDEILRLKGLRE